MKEGTVLKSAVPDQEEMGEINRYTRREYGPQEVYAFSLALCDNEIDRDFERFSVEALETLGELFLGKTCIFDHEQKSVNQTARIYRTALRREPGRKTRAGEEYVQLTARAYLPKTQGNGEVIELIESGILKEVSVSCSVKRKVCGLCGREHCGHEKGKEYPEGLWHLVLLEPTQEELELAGQVQEVFPPQQYGERMLIVPRLPGSSVIIQQLNYDSEGGLTGAQEIWRAQGQPEAVLLQQDVPEGYPTLRVVIQSGAHTGSYEVAYYGRGDGRRDFYVWLDRED